MRTLSFLLRVGLFALRVLSQSSSLNHCMYGNVPVVKTLGGLVAGIEATSRNGAPYYAFYGIPYTDRPARFQPPSFLPPKKWTGVRDASYHRQACLQYDGKRIAGHEDCLYLNVFTPQLNGSLPVIVFIHGGRFQVGTSHIYGAQYFMDEPVVLVTFNYRLGALGFLSTADGVIDGNMGLKDQVAALQWVRQNINRFGGHPEMVTLFGEDAGAVSASLHRLSPMSRGLFRKAITTSGAALNPWALSRRPARTSRELAQKLYCPQDDSRALRECLLRKSPGEIVLQTLPKWRQLDPVVPFGPVIESGGWETGGKFLTEAPYDTLMSGRFETLPWMAGLVQDDGLYTRAAPILKSPQLVADLNYNWSQLAPITLIYSDSGGRQSELNLISAKIRNVYFQGEELREGNPQPLIDLYTDRLVTHGLRTTMMLEAQKGSPVYPFIFAYNGSYSFLQQKNYYRGYGVSHADELQYLFSGIAPAYPRYGRDEQFSRKLVQLWVQFARTGKPFQSFVDGSYPREVTWNPMGEQEASGIASLRYYRIQENAQVLRDPFSARMAFWDQLMIDHEPVRFPRGGRSQVDPAFIL